MSFFAPALCNNSICGQTMKAVTGGSRRASKAGKCELKHRMEPLSCGGTGVASPSGLDRSSQVSRPRPAALGQSLVIVAAARAIAMPLQCPAGAFMIVAERARNRGAK